MTQEQDNYSNASQLENFLSAAFRHDKRVSRAYIRELQNLIDAEKGLSTKTLGSAEKQLKEIKKRLLKAIDIFLSLDIDEVERKEISSLIDLVHSCENSFDVSQLVEKGLPYIKRLRGYKR